MSVQQCKHKFVYGGVKYDISKYNLAGSGARERTYFDWFFCEKCLENLFVALSHESTDNTYEHVKFNATPMPGNKS